MTARDPSDSGELKPVAKPDESRAAANASWRCWLWTTTGIVSMLLLVQFSTGLLLAFYYVPSVDHAHTTVSFIEKVLPAGSWLRSLHYHGSQWLPLFFFLQVVELFARRAYTYNKNRWVAAVLLLALVFAAAATGYSLPWDARAFFSTRVAEGIMNGLPLVGAAARRWLLGSSEISTLTLSRFFALHVLVTPFVILLVVGWQLFVRSANRSRRAMTGVDSDGSTAAELRAFNNQLTRNVLIATLAFVLLAVFSYKLPAPIGPAAANANVDYLPRPGVQFLWLYQTLKYLPGSLGSLFAIVLPGVVFSTLAALPWLDKFSRPRIANDRRRKIGATILALSFVFVVTMTVVSYVSDRRDPRTQQQLARQAAEEATFRREPFVPTPLEQGDAAKAALAITSPSPGIAAAGPPAVYTKLCASCHGEHGEGARQGPLKFPALLGVADKPHRSLDDVIGILNDPKAYGLEPPMKSFATKLSDDEKREVASWVVTLKKNN
ncbi:MAG TPA: cytochrome b N-terminal domain-containing protein [Pyrinomonadaceae bacterium]|nr:cytochrome b N-terminal domain-containing protein [Pyrinomonadaceae bacterium]